MKNRWMLFVTVGAVALASPQIFAQDALRSSGQDAALFRQEAEARAQEAARKGELADAIVAARQTASGRDMGARLRDSLKQSLFLLSVERLEAFLAADGLGDIEAAVRESVSPTALGDAAADLAFTPVAPCRVVDTRTAAAGLLVAGTAQSFLVRNAGGFATQGGSATDCGIPATATAVEMNYVAVGPAGPGDLRAFAFGGTLPSASVINYSNLSGLNIANGIAQPVCNPATTTCTKDLTVLADVANTHLIVDVVGYFNKVNTAAVKSFSVNTTTGPGVQIALPVACANTGAAQVTIVAPVAGKIVAKAESAYVLAHTTGTPSIIISAVGTTATDCATGGAGLLFNAIRLDSPAGTGTYVFPIPASRVVSVAAGSSTTLFLNSQVNAGTGHSIYSGRLEATFIPN